MDRFPENVSLDSINDTLQIRDSNVPSKPDASNFRQSSCNCDISKEIDNQLSQNSSRGKSPISPIYSSPDSSEPVDNDTNQTCPSPAYSVPVNDDNISHQNDNPNLDSPEVLKSDDDNDGDNDNVHLPHLDRGSRDLFESFSSGVQEDTIPNQLRLARIPVSANILEVPDYFLSAGYSHPEEVGQGFNGDVLKVVSIYNPNNIKAVKYFSFWDCKRSPEFLKRMFYKEVAVLQSLNHRHILQTQSAYLCCGYGIMEMEYFPEGTLRNVMDSRPQDLLYRFFVQIACALRYLHSKRYVHRDVKLDNVLVRGQDAILIDFGFTDYIPEDTDSATGWVGTRPYMAPEVRYVKRGDTYDPFLADAFSLGVVLWALVTGMRPRSDTPFRRELRQMAGSVDAVAYNATFALLRRDASVRYGVREILDYFNQCRWNTDLIDAL